jgi:hypothetical protein
MADLQFLQKKSRTNVGSTWFKSTPWTEATFLVTGRVSTLILTKYYRTGVRETLRGLVISTRRSRTNIGGVDRSDVTAVGTIDALRRLNDQPISFMIARAASRFFSA